MTAAGPSKSTTRKKKDAPVTEESDWENHWLLRVPETYAEQLRKFCETRSPKEKLRIRFDQDQRHGTLSIGANTLYFTIYDLPCIIEVMKTIDKINLFKVNNLSQMILCSEEPQQMPASRSLSQQPSTSTATKTLEDTENETNQSELSKQKSEKMYQYPHGILPPLKNVRKRRFRKTKKKKYMDAPEVEKEVKRLLRADLSATRTWYEIVTDDNAGQESPKKAAIKSSVSKQRSHDEKTTEDNFYERDILEEAQKELEIDGSPASSPAPNKDVLAVFGEISSSEDENEDDD